MKKQISTVFGGGLSLIALSQGGCDPSILKADFSAKNAPKSSHQQMSEHEMRSIEASHLEVYAGCKWGHAAFDPVKIESEMLSPEIKSLHLMMA